MNVIREHVAANLEKYQKVHTEFANENKEFRGIVKLKGEGYYGMIMNNVVVFPRYAYDMRNPL